MNTINKIFVILAGIFFISGGLFAQNSIFEKTYPTDANNKLSYGIIIGDVSVKSWDKQEVKITIKGNEKLKDALEIREITSGGDIKISVKVENGNIKGNENLISEIFVPSLYNIEIKTNGGDLNAENINGEIDFKTAGGEIKINNSKGELNIKTAGGNISVTNHKGDINATTAGGEVDIISYGGEIKVSSMGGNIDLVYSGENKGIKLSTMGGDIDLKIPSDTKADLKLNTTGGEISVGFDVENSKKSENSLKGIINGGGESIKCTTMGGNISIHK